AWALCFVGAHLLARELGLGRIGASAAGVAFAYAPYRITEAGHLHVISSGGIPLALFLLLRGYRRWGNTGQSGADTGESTASGQAGARSGSSTRLLVAGWLVVAWQISLGFTLGLQFAYLLAILTLIWAVHWWRAGRPALPPKLVAITCAGIALVGIVTIYEARPYLKISHDYPTARRPLMEVKRYSAGPEALLAASSENRVWGDATAPLRADLSSQNESVLFPGLTILLLAGLGLAGAGRAGGAVGTRDDRAGAGLGLGATPFPWGLRIGLALCAVTCAVLALGFGLTGAGYPYRLLYDHAPGWNGVRVPGRVFTLATLSLALLAGAGAQRLVGVARARGGRVSPLWRDGLPALVGLVLLAGLLGEGAGRMAHPVVPRPAPAEIGLPAPILDLPTDSASDRVWQFFSTEGFPKIANGTSTFDIPAQDDLRGGMSGFPDRASVEKLRWYGIRTVVLHLRLPKLPGLHGFGVAEPPDPEAAAVKPVTGLGITRRRVGEVVIYEIGPGPKALHA
ncbi:MAG TPA: hypothetical protein VGX16_04710, partial [Solirubrobacteraceae bacterium]|nr:hypothetical protein [Solirubrobacteraceae bacterium]